MIRDALSMLLKPRCCWVREEYATLTGTMREMLRGERCARKYLKMRGGLAQARKSERKYLKGFKSIGRYWGEKKKYK